MRRTVLCLLLAATAIAAQDTAQVEGRVLTTEGKPVPRADVYLSRAGQSTGGAYRNGEFYQEVTGGDGTFVAAGLPPGVYAISVRAANFVDPPSAAAASRSFTLTPGEVHRDVEYRLLPLATVTGVVLDTDGEPVSDVDVALAAYSVSFGERHLQQVHAGLETDDTGRFQFRGVQPGRYYLIATPRKQPEEAFPAIYVLGPSVPPPPRTTYYPNAALPEDATWIEVASAPVKNLVIRLRRDRGHSVRGRVDPVRPAPSDIAVLDQQGQRVAGSTTMAQGEFAIGNLLPGRYTLAASYRNPAVNFPRGEYQAAGRAEIVVDNKDLDGVVVPVREFLTLTVRLSLEVDGAPQAQRAERSPSGSFMTLQAAEPLPAQPPDALVNNDGSLRFERLWPARYRIITPPLLAKPNARVAAVRLGDQDLTTNIVDLSHGVPGPLEFIYTIARGDLFVKTPPPPSPTAPASAETVTVWSQRPQFQDSRLGVASANLSPSAALSLVGSIPGVYYAVAWEESPQDLVFDRAFLARFEDLALRIDLQEGGNLTVTAPRISRDALRKVLETYP